MSGSGQLALDVIDGEVPLAQGDDPFTDAIAERGGAGTVAGRLKEAGALVGVMAELVAEHPESAGRIGEATGHNGRRKSLDEIGAEGLVLALRGGLRGQEKLGSLVEC